MGCGIGGLLTTGPAHVDTIEKIYSGIKSGYYSADVLQYGRFDIRGKGEPQKTIKIDDGVLYAPGPRGIPTPVIEIQKGLEKYFEDELFDIINLLEKANFTTINRITKPEKSNNRAITMARGNILLTLTYKTSEEQLWPNPSSFSIYSLFIDHPKRYVGKAVILSYEICKTGELSEEEKLLADGINAELLQKHNFKKLSS